MNTFLLIVAAVVVGLVVVLTLAWYWFKSRLSALSAEASPRASASGIPPFRINLVAVDGGRWRQSAEVETVSRTIENSGFKPLADYAIPEMRDMVVRGFCDRKRAAYAIIYEHPQVGLVVDLVRIHKDVTATVTTAPDDGLDHPQNSLRTEVALPASALDKAGVLATWTQMLTELDSLSAGRTPIPALAKTFVAAFTSSYAAEMDWRIRRGGVSAEEIRRVATTGGQNEPDADAIRAVQTIWRNTIDDFIGAEVITAFLRAESFPAAEWEQTRDRVFVVHEQSNADSLCDALCAGVVFDDQEPEQAQARIRAMRAQLDAVFSESEALPGFKTAQAVLPSTQRFTELANLDRPWRAAIYLRPASNQFTA